MDGIHSYQSTVRQQFDAICFANLPHLYRGPRVNERKLILISIVTKASEKTWTRYDVPEPGWTEWTLRYLLLVRDFRYRNCKGPNFQLGHLLEGTVAH